MTYGTDAIAAERARQIIEEGYTPANDYGRGGQLAAAGESYAAMAAVTLKHFAQLTPEQVLSSGGQTVPPLWPWSSHYWKPTGDPKRDLIKAGALIAAAIDALEAS